MRGPVDDRRPVVPHGRLVLRRRASARLRAGRHRTRAVVGTTRSTNRRRAPPGCPPPPAPAPRAPPRRRSRSTPRPASGRRHPARRSGRRVRRPAGTARPAPTLSTVGALDRARDVAADPVDRLDLAAVALGGPGVQQHPGAGQRGGGVRVEQRQGPRLRGEVARFRTSGAPVSKRTVPGGESAVQHPDVPVPRPAQQPPGARRAPSRSRRRRRRPAARRRPPHGASRAGRRRASGSGWRPPAPAGPASSVVQVDVARAGQVARLVLRPPRRGRRAASGRRAGPAGTASLAQRTYGDDGIHTTHCVRCHLAHEYRPPGDRRCTGAGRVVDRIQNRPFSSAGSGRSGAAGALGGPGGESIVTARSAPRSAPPGDEFDAEERFR